MRTEVYWVPGPWPGRLGILPRPRGGDWLEDEVPSWRNSGLDVVTSLLTPDEVPELGLQDEAARSRGGTGVPCVSHPRPRRPRVPCGDGQPADRPGTSAEVREERCRTLPAGHRTIVSRHRIPARLRRRRSGRSVSPDREGSRDIRAGYDRATRVGGSGDHGLSGYPLSGPRQTDVRTASAQSIQHTWQACTAAGVAPPG